MILTFNIINGDALTVLRTMPDQSVHCVVTSPPYYYLRDYGVEGQIGLEQSPEEYIEKLVVIFWEVRRVLANNGTLWLNLGDSYSGSNKGHQGDGTHCCGPMQRTNHASLIGKTPATIRPKNIYMIPAKVAIALQDDGWILRQDIIWAKTCGMPESVEDRTTKSHEYIFLFSKRPKYYFDYKAIMTFSKDYGQKDRSKGKYHSKEWEEQTGQSKHCGLEDENYAESGARCRSVWHMPTGQYKGAHFATFPIELPERCMLAGCPEGGVVLDPFSGAATTGIAAIKSNRNYIGIELNKEYIDLSVERMQEAFPPAAKLDALYEDENHPAEAYSKQGRRTAEWLEE